MNRRSKRNSTTPQENTADREARCSRRLTKAAAVQHGRTGASGTDFCGTSARLIERTMKNRRVNRSSSIHTSSLPRTPTQHYVHTQVQSIQPTNPKRTRPNRIQLDDGSLCASKSHNHAQHNPFNTHGFITNRFNSNNNKQQQTTNKSKGGSSLSSLSSSSCCNTIIVTH